MLRLLCSKTSKKTCNSFFIHQRSFSAFKILPTSTGIASISRHNLRIFFSLSRNKVTARQERSRSDMASDGHYIPTNVIAVCQLASKNNVMENFRMCKDLVEKAKARRAKVSQHLEL